MKVETFIYTLCHVKVSFHSDSVAGQLGQKTLMVCPPTSVSLVSCHASSFTTKAECSQLTTFPSHLQACQARAMALCLMGFVLNGLHGGAQT